jgi:hypothetical protein
MSLNYKSIFSIAFLFILSTGLPNSLSEKSKISLLTCDEGTEIYTLFGHSAIRVYDPENGVDDVYNWGMFSFSESELEFGYDFAKGRLKYFLGKQKFQNFIYEYLFYKRGVREQVLNLNQAQKESLYSALQKNYLPENRAYQYDFFYDNCSSRIRDIITSSIGENLQLATHEDDSNYSFRQLIDIRLKQNPWLDLGIDLVLGAKIDDKASNFHLMFLPSYMEIILDNSFIKDENGKKQPLIQNKSILLLSEKELDKAPTNTANYFWIVLIFTLIVGVINTKWLNNFWFGTLLFIGALLSIVLVFMWIGTDHQATKENLNLIWASPLLLISFISLFSKKLTIKLRLFYLVMTVLFFIFVLFWFIFPQEFHTSIRPLILALTLIHYFLFNKSKKLSKQV